MNPFSAVEVVNRRSIQVEGMFGGVPIVFQPHEAQHLPPNVAIALVTGSMLKMNLATGITEVFALGITGDVAYPTDALEGPLASTNPVELLDRRDVQKLTETEPKALTSSGAESLGVGTVEKTIQPMPGEPNAENADIRVAPAADDDVRAVNFKNPEANQNRRGGSQSRISNKTS